MLSYLFTDNTPKKHNMLDNQLECDKCDCTNKIIPAYTGSVDNTEFENDDEEEIEGEVTKDGEGNLVFLSGMPIMSDLLDLASDDDEEESEFKMTGATHLYASGMTIIGLFILYRLMMRYK